MGSRGSSLTAVAIFFLVLTSITVLLRFYTRVFILRKIAFDDYVVLFCQLNFIGFVICVIKQVDYGFGDHLTDILMRNPDDLVTAMKWFFAGQHFFAFSTCIIKIAIVHFFYSLHPSRALRVLAIFGVTLNVLTGVAIEIWQTFQCAPIKYFWTRMTFRDMTGKCWDPHKSFDLVMVLTSMDIISDAALAVLPAFLVWNIKLSAPKKAMVSALLGMGVMSTVAPNIRLFYLKDLTYDATDFTCMLIKSVEPAILIIAVCCAQIRPLVRKMVLKSWPTCADAEPKPNSPNNPVNLGHPPTIGAGNNRSRCRGFGISLLESTFGRSYSLTMETTQRPLEETSVSLRDDRLSAGDMINLEKNSKELYSECV